MTAPLQSFQLSFDGDTRGGFVAESFGTNKVEVVGDRDEHGVLKGFAVQGNNRLFAVRDYVWAHKWSDVNYRKLDLLGKALSFTVDLSEVPCGCNAAIYLVQMDAPVGERSNYCDIQGFDSDFDEVEPCTEIDLLEGNAKAVQATLHTTKGRGSVAQDGEEHDKVGHRTRAAWLQDCGAPRTSLAGEYTEYVERE